MRLGYRPGLDGLRGIAILAVTAYHFGGIAHGGFYGVDLFFVLSGFLITGLLLEEHRLTGTVSLRRFYNRRIRRLLPAAAAASLAAGTGYAIIHGAGAALVMVAEGALYLANVLHTVIQPDPLAGSPLGHFWSLAQEEQFYLVWPPLLIILLHRRVRHVGYALLTVAAALMVYRVALSAAGASFHRLYFSPDTHMDGIVLGCAAAYLRGRWTPPGWLAVAAASVFGWFVMFTGKAVFPVGVAAVEIASAILVVYAAEQDPRALTSRPLVAVGKVSYGLYVWQAPVLWAFGWTGHFIPALAVTAALTVVSYRWVEMPFRARGRSRRSSRVDSRAPQAVAAVPGSRPIPQTAAPRAS